MIGNGVTADHTQAVSRSSPRRGTMMLLADAVYVMPITPERHLGVGLPMHQAPQ